MSKASKQKFTELLKSEDSVAPAGSPKTTLKELLGAAKEIGGAIWDGAAPMVDHGSTEVLNGLMNGNAFTPYGWSQTSEGPEVEAPKTPDLGQEQDRGIEL